MKVYVMTTGTIFGLLTIAHLSRMVMESRAFARDPWYILITVVAAALCFWAFRLVRQSTRS